MLRTFRWPPKPAQPLPAHSDQVTSVAVSADGKFFVSGGRDRLVQLINAIGNKRLRSLAGQAEPVTAVAISGITASGRLASLRGHY